MSVTFTAPYPYNQTTTIVRNPSWNDTVNIKDEMEVKRAMDGTLYTYVKKQATRRRLLLQFVLDSWKAMELESFFKSYYAARIYVKDHLGNEWIGYAVNSPFEFVTDGTGGKRGHRTGLPTNLGGEELVSVTIELEVVPLGHEGDL
jgi:hypothetical protein